MNESIFRGEAGKPVEISDDPHQPHKPEWVAKPVGVVLAIRDWAENEPEGSLTTTHDLAFTLGYNRKQIGNALVYINKLHKKGKSTLWFDSRRDKGQLVRILHKQPQANPVNKTPIATVAQGDLCTGDLLEVVGFRGTTPIVRNVATYQVYEISENS